MRDEYGLTTESYMQAIMIGERTPHRGPVELVDYDPSWPELYRREDERIRGALGAKALLLEHVGSTSVPGLAAKPVIDIVLAVADAAGEPAYVPDLERAGYDLSAREPDWYEHRLFKDADPAVHLHVFSAGCPEVERMRRFRDHLRADDADRRLYEAIKRELAARTWEHVQHYADSKSEVVEQLLERAQAR